MSRPKVLLAILLASLASTVVAQTQPAAKAKAAPAKPNVMVVESGSENWGDVPFAALVGTPSVDLGGTLRLAVLQGNPPRPGARTP